MAKRRTKKQKQTARHATLSWDKGVGLGTNVKPVKGEIKNETKTSKQKSSTNKNSVSLVKDDNIRTIKRDILRTLAITTLILGLELVLYWAL